MKDKALIFFAVMLCCLPGLLRGQAEPEEASIKIVSYIIIKGDKLKNVAIRFQVPVRTLKKLNRLPSKNFTVYPGLTIEVPVKVRPKVWDPTKEDMSDNGILSQDRRPSVDYEIVGEGFDYDMRDDFIAVSEAVDDSLQFEKVGVHMKKIDKRIAVLSYRIDSVKQADDFRYDESNINSVLGKMKMARDNYYINGPLGKEIDSLNKIKVKLANLRIRLRNKITEYEYLMDNTAYAKDHYAKDEKNRDTHWGDQITYESNYARSMARHKRIITQDTAAVHYIDSVKAVSEIAKKDTAILPVASPTIRDTVTTARTAMPADVKDALTVPASVVISENTIHTVPATVVKDEIVAPTQLPKPATAVKAPEGTLPAKQSVPQVRSSPFGLNQKVDIAPLLVKNVLVELKHTSKRELALLPAQDITAPTVKIAPSVAVKDRLTIAAKINTAESVTEPAPPILAKRDTPAITAKPDAGAPEVKTNAASIAEDIVPKKSVKADTAAPEAKSTTTTSTAETMATDKSVKADTALPVAKSPATSPTKETTPPLTIGKTDTTMTEVKTLASALAKETTVSFPTLRRDTSVSLAQPATAVPTQINISSSTDIRKDSATQAAKASIPILSKSNPVILKADPTASKPAATTDISTLPKPDTAQKVLNAILDTIHKNSIRVSIQDTITLPANTKVPAPPVDAAAKSDILKDTMSRRAATVAVKTNDTAAEREAAIVKKDNESPKAITGPPIRKQDNDKPAVVKTEPAIGNIEAEKEMAGANRERVEKEKNERQKTEKERRERQGTEDAEAEQKEIALKTPVVKIPKRQEDDALRPARRNEDTTVRTAAPVVDSSLIPAQQVKAADIKYRTKEMIPPTGPRLALDIRYDSAMLYKEVVISQDPLASYKTDSNFVITNVQLKEIPITEFKNKPKYLIPVDSISQIKAEFYLIRARQVLEKGDFKEGDKYLRKSLELNPNNAATWMLHADLCLTTGAVDKALKEYAISGQIDSGNPKVFYNIALLYAKANDEQKAYKYFSKATDVNDKYLLAYMGRASVLMDTRDYEGAIQDYDKTLNINKYYSPAYKGRALAKMEARRFNEAVIDFNQYLEIEDPDGYVLYQRGIAKILSNNLLQGCLDLSSSLELGFKDAEKAIKKFCE